VTQRNSPLRLRFADGEFTVSARTTDVGEAAESNEVGERQPSLRPASALPFSRLSQSVRAASSQVGNPAEPITDEVLFVGASSEGAASYLTSIRAN
jgi:hypothetical protein